VVVDRMLRRGRAGEGAMRRAPAAAAASPWTLSMVAAWRLTGDVEARLRPCAVRWCAAVVHPLVLHSKIKGIILYKHGLSVRTLYNTSRSQSAV
jgi:hypothetical protein